MNKEAIKQILKTGDTNLDSLIKRFELLLADQTNVLSNCRDIKHDLEGIMPENYAPEHPVWSKIDRSIHSTQEIYDYMINMPRYWELQCILNLLAVLKDNQDE